MAGKYAECVWSKNKYDFRTMSEQQFQSSVMDELRLEMEADAEYNAWLDRINAEMREVANEQQG